jgi:hypothetical protein
MNDNGIPLQTLNVDQVEGETAGAQAGGGGINFVLGARNWLGSLNLTAETGQVKSRTMTRHTDEHVEGRCESQQD